MRREEKVILNKLINLHLEEIHEIDAQVVELIRLRSSLLRQMHKLQKKAALSTLESIAKFVRGALRKNRDRVDEANSREIL